MFADPRKYIVKAEGFSKSDSNGRTWPIPVVRDGKVQILVTLFFASGQIGRAHGDPFYAVYMAPDGSVEEHGPREPKDVGIVDVKRRVTDVDDVVGGLDLADAQERLYAICPPLWQAWVDRATGPKAESEAKKYWDIHRVITSPREGGWYEQMSPEFFEWLRREAGAWPMGTSAPSARAPKTGGSAQIFQSHDAKGCNCKPTDPLCDCL